MINRIAQIALAILCIFPGAGHSAAPERILSLGLCADWLIAHHADRDNVVALSQLQRRYPIDWIGPEWPVHDGSLEQVVTLRPDLVLSGQYSATQIRQRLETLGVHVEVLPLPRSLEQVVDYEKQFLRALQLPETLASVVPAPMPERKSG
ncbi:MAG TPA: ABC transporter substrate-binding protein, partial [Pseudomonas sp.]|nr:ABC transporter substrate-binding protein [Pseudomonas sp.]